MPEATEILKSEKSTALSTASACYYFGQHGVLRPTGIQTMGAERRHTNTDDSRLTFALHRFADTIDRFEVALLQLEALADQFDPPLARSGQPLAPDDLCPKQKSQRRLRIVPPLLDLSP